MERWMQLQFLSRDTKAKISLQKVADSSRVQISVPYPCVSLRVPILSYERHRHLGGINCINGHEFEQTLGDREGQGSLASCNPQGCRVRHDLATEQQNQLSFSRLPGNFCDLRARTKRTTHFFSFSSSLPTYCSQWLLWI